MLKRPEQAFGSQAQIDARWRELNYSGAPQFERARAEYARFAELLEQHADEVHFLPEAQGVDLDSMYVRDSAIITRAGAVLCNMGKAARAGEPAATGAVLRELDIPILGEVTGDGRLEGGDVIWFDDTTLVVGRGYRTNDAGIEQLWEITRDIVTDLVMVALPHWHGPDDVMHLMSIISPVDRDLAVVYSPLLPVPFRQWLIEHGVELVEVPDDEFTSMGCNVLALAPRKCLMLEGNRVTRARLEAAGALVLTYKGDEISHKGAGGPTCLTRPLLRG